MALQNKSKPTILGGYKPSIVGIFSLYKTIEWNSKVEVVKIGLVSVLYQDYTGYIHSEWP